MTDRAILPYALDALVAAREFRNEFVAGKRGDELAANNPDARRWFFRGYAAALEHERENAGPTGG